MDHPEVDYEYLDPCFITDIKEDKKSLWQI